MTDGIEDVVNGNTHEVLDEPSTTNTTENMITSCRIYKYDEDNTEKFERLSKRFTDTFPVRIVDTEFQLSTKQSTHIYGLKM